MSKDGKKLLVTALLPIGLTVAGLALGFGAGKPAGEMMRAKLNTIVALGNPDFDYEVENIDLTKTPTEGTVSKTTLKMPSVGYAYGTISCDTLSLKAPLYYGDSDEVLQKGAGQYTGSSLPGEGGCILIGAHDGTWFAPLEEVQTGDAFTVKTTYGTYTYEVTETKIAKATEKTAWKLDAKEETLVLYTCYPFGKNTDRSDRFYVYCKKTAGPEIKEDSDEQQTETK